MKQFDRTMDILTKAIQSISEEKFLQLVNQSLETIRQGGKIIVSGLGKNVSICEKFVGTLHSVGIAAAFMHTNSAVHGDLGMVRKEDLLIVLTKSGETTESVYLVEHLKKKQCCIWLLSFSPESYLTKMVPQALILELDHEGDMWNTLPNHSTTINLIVLQELAMLLVERLQIPREVLLENHPGGAIGAEGQGEII